MKMSSPTKRHKNSSSSNNNNDGDINYKTYTANIDSTVVVFNVGYQSLPVIQLLTIIRDRTSTRIMYQEAMDRLSTRLADEAFARLHCITSKTIITPTNQSYVGLNSPNHDSIVLISILRSGDILLDACKKLAPKSQVGKILIQRDEHHQDKTPILHWKKIPTDLVDKDIIVCDPMLATGGTLLCCITELVKCGAIPARILFLNIISCPEGLLALHQLFPQVRVVTAAIDEGLNDLKYIVPGLGDAGDRYYGV
jgi:uracil phosphoribosyltransferase